MPIDGLSRPIGAGVDVHLAGKAWLARPLTLWDLGVIEYHLLAELGTPVDRVEREIAGGAVPDELADELRARAFQDLERDRGSRLVPWADAMTWLHSADGMAYSAWLCLRREHPDDWGRLDQAQELWTATSVAEQREFAKRRNMVSGFDAAANLDWPKDAAEDKSPKQPAYLPWRRVIAELFDAGLSSEQIGRMTLYELRLVRSDRKTMGGHARMTRDEYAAFKAARQERTTA